MVGPCVKEDLGNKNGMYKGHFLENILGIKLRYHWEVMFVALLVS